MPTLLVIVARAAALVALCAAGGLEHAEVLLSSEAEESDCCVAKVNELQLHLAELRAENIALRKVNERVASDLDECRVWRLAAEHDHRNEPSVAATRKDAPAPPLSHVPASRRKALATSAPTPFTPIPTPFTPIPTTATPSATPSASPVPTTEGITTHSQLAAAVADSANSVVVVEADVTFPPLSVIIVDSGRSVSVVGRSAVDGGRVVFDGAGHSQHFWVRGGTLHIAFVNLVNGTASNTDSYCTPDYWECSGGSIGVMDGGILVMRSCDVRGGGGVSRAYYGGGVNVYGDTTIGEFYNVSFFDLRAAYGAALRRRG